MYLRHLHVQNVKLLRDVKIDFVGAGGQPRMWTVFVGENRSCKTTLLQTIAAAASGSDQATHLTTDVVSSWPDLRRSKAELSIDATFELGRHVNIRHDDVSLLSRSLVTHLELKPGRSVFEGSARFHEVDIGADPLVTARRENSAGWFVAGYGVRRMLRGVGTIFVAGGLLPHVTAIELRGRGGIRSVHDLIEAQRFEMDILDERRERIRVPAVWLSQGYQSTIAWLADVVGQILLDQGTSVEAEDMEGCVLVDEIDLCLHPTWQVRLIPALKRVFPKLQFIATTHSPMVLPALAADEVWLLSHDVEGSVIATPAARSPALLTGSELLETFFEIHKLYPSDLGDKANKYGRLATDSTRTAEEEAQMLTLRHELAAAGVEFDWEPVPREAPE